MNELLKSWSRAPRNLEEVQRVLMAIAKKTGIAHGVDLSVGLRGEDLYFVDGAGQDIVDPGGLDNSAAIILCASAKEIDSGDFLKLFTGRVHYAALTARFNQEDVGK